jgi:hypothetical protein
VFGFAPLHLTPTLARLTLEVDQRMGADQRLVMDRKPPEFQQHAVSLEHISNMVTKWRHK